MQMLNIYRQPVLNIAQETCEPDHYCVCSPFCSVLGPWAHQEQCLLKKGKRSSVNNELEIDFSLSNKIVLLPSYFPSTLTEVTKGL